MLYLHSNPYFVKLNSKYIPKNLFIVYKKNGDKVLKKYQKRVSINMIDEKIENNLKIASEKEKIFFEGPPSKSELIIPFISILTVIGIIPFISTLFRQFWVSYKITNRRISVKSGFQGNNKVEIVYRDIKKISYITRFGGLTADLVILLKDNARLEIRSLPNWEKNVEFIKNNCPDYVNWN